VRLSDILTMNIFGLDHSPNGPRASSRVPTSGAARGVHGWSGLPRPERIILNRVAICRACRFGVDAEGQTVAVDWFGPELVSAGRAKQLIASGQAKFFGLAGESK
jgi:hypothetical protein